MTKKMQVDRFEEGFAVLVDEDETIYNVPRETFGFDLHEGDFLAVEFSGNTPVSARFLAEETAAAKERIAALMKKLKKKI